MPSVLHHTQARQPKSRGCPRLENEFSNRVHARAETNHRGGFRLGDQGPGRDFGWQGGCVAASATALVERFYDVVWNKADERAAREILDPNFIFRASLGPDLRGPDGFIAYLRSVHAALQNFTCTIEDLIATEDRAAAKMRFTGRHRAKFFGIEATGRHVAWSGAAFFSARGGRISELWVLGDVEAVMRQLMPERTPQGFAM